MVFFSNITKQISTVIKPGSDRRDGDATSDGVKVVLYKHHSGRVSAVAPAPHADTIFIYK